MILNGKLLKLLCYSVMKGVDKVPDQWFDKIPVIGKFYHAPGESKGNAKSSTGDSRYSKDERRTRNKRSQQRRRSHGDVETRYDDQIYSPDGSKRRSRSGHKSPRSQRRSDRPFTDNMEGIGMPRAYNPADYVSTPSGIDPFSPAQKDNGTVSRTLINRLHDLTEDRYWACRFPSEDPRHVEHRQALTCHTPSSILTEAAAAAIQCPHQWRRDHSVHSHRSMRRKAARGPCPSHISI